MRAYRALLLRHGIMRLPPGMQQKVAALLRVKEELRRWASEWARSNGKVPMPQEQPLRYLAKEFVHAWNALRWLREHVVEHGMRVPLILDAQLRLGGERDVGRGAARWILARVREGARLVLAMVWVDSTRLCVALVFRREAKPVEPKRLLAIDLNALHNGIAYAVVERDRVLRRGVLRPDARKLARLQREAARLDSLCARKGGVHCDMAGAAKSRIYRLLREWEGEAARFIIKLALQYRAAIVIDVPDDSSMRELKESNSYPAGRKAMLDLGRLRGLVRGLAEWHGVPCIEARLYSSVCPKCEAKMQELQNRHVRCARCGMEAHRDDVPIMWAQRRFDELLELSKSHTSFSAQFRMLINPRVPALT